MRTAPADIMRGMRTTWLVPIVLTGLSALAGLSACATPGPAGPQPPQGTEEPSPAGGARPPSSVAAPPPRAPPERPATPPARQFRLSPAASALVAQAHRQALGGDYGQAGATLERAVRIEPDNPLVWIELGRVQLAENNPTQADAMARKALSLGTGDAAAQSSAWRLIADSLRVRGRNGEAAQAEHRAASLASH